MSFSAFRMTYHAVLVVATLCLFELAASGEEIGGEPAGLSRSAAADRRRRPPTSRPGRARRPSRRPMIVPGDFSTCWTSHGMPPHALTPK